MKNKYLYLAFLLCAALYVNPLILKGIVLLVGLIFYYVRYRFAYHIICVTSILIVGYLSFQTSEIQSKILQVDDIRTNYVVASDGNNQCLLYNVENVNLDDIIEVRGTYDVIHSTQNADTYQFSKQMKRRNITQSMNVIEHRIVKFATTFRSRIYAFISNSKQIENRDNALKVLYRIDEERDDFSYYLYASGIHLSFLIHCLSKVFNKKRGYMALLVSSAYMLFFNTPFFILRIFIFSIIPLFFPKHNGKDQLGLSILACVLYKPAMLYELCFIIPVVFRVVSLFKVVKLNRYVTTFLVLFPLLQFFFHEINLLTILLFPLFKMMQGIHFIGTIVSLFFSFIFPLVKLVEQLQLFFLQTVKVDFLSITGKPYLLWMVVWFSVVVLIMSQYRKKYMYILLALFLFQTQLKVLFPFYEVTFLDVGQGDCILIREPYFGQVILIDVAGHRKRDVAKINVYPYLKSKGISKIDKVIITHDDMDHSGGLASLQELIEVKEVIYTKQEVALDTFSLYSIADTIYEDKNDNSIVLFTQIYQKRLLFMGDASRGVEKDIMKVYDQLKADIIKVGHHGSKTSSAPSFLHLLQPQLGVITSGYNNFYGHPHQETLQALQKNQIPYLDTQEVGSIHLYFLPFAQFVRTGSGEFGIMN